MILSLFLHFTIIKYMRVIGVDVGYGWTKVYTEEERMKFLTVVAKSFYI